MWYYHMIEELWFFEELSKFMELGGGKVYSIINLQHCKRLIFLFHILSSLIKSAVCQTWSIAKVEGKN